MNNLYAIICTCCVIFVSSCEGKKQHYNKVYMGKVTVYKVDEKKWVEEGCKEIKPYEVAEFSCRVYNNDYEYYSIKFDNKEYILEKLESPKYGKYLGADIVFLYNIGIYGYVENIPNIHNGNHIKKHTEKAKIFSLEANEDDVQLDISESSYLSVSEDYITFDEDGESKTIDVYSNEKWEFDSKPDKWVKVYVSQNRISLRAERNYDEWRSSEFSIKTSSNEVIIQLSQAKSNKCKPCKGTGKCKGDGSNEWQGNPWSGEMEMLHKWTTTEYRMEYDVYYNTYLPQFYTVMKVCGKCGGTGICPDCGGNGISY